VTGGGRRAVHLTIRGRVQAVGYRAWAVEAARRLGLDGWVRNRADGTVEAVAAGDAAAVEAFVAACRSGPALARVTGVEPTEVDPAQAGTGGFEPRPTV
jgi:acylphosphatase